jgi:RNA polymerase sigma-70 factor (ECF subfamily)
MVIKARATAERQGVDSDEALVARLCQGDTEALQPLMTRHASRVVALCGCYLDRASAEDATQETFVRVLERCGTMKRSMAFRPWLYAIARNVCLGMLRRERVRAAVPLEDLVATADPPDQVVTEREQFQAALREVNRLPQHYREVIIMCFLLNLTCAEAAAALGVKPGTVRVRLHRALRRVRESLTEWGRLS